MRCATLGCLGRAPALLAFDPPERIYQPVYPWLRDAVGQQIPLALRAAEAEVRVAAVEALAAMLDAAFTAVGEAAAGMPGMPLPYLPAMAALLLEALADEDEEVRQAALEGLDRCLYGASCEASCDASCEASCEAARCRGQRDEAAAAEQPAAEPAPRESDRTLPMHSLPHLGEGAEVVGGRGNEGSGWGSARRARVLSKVRARVEAGAAALSRHADSDTRHAAVTLLGYALAASAEGLEVEALEAADEAGRARGAGGKPGGEDAEEAEGEAGGRPGAARPAAGRDGGGAVAAVLAALEDVEWDVRHAGLTALARLPACALAVHAARLLDLLEDPSAEVHAAALAAIAQLPAATLTPLATARRVTELLEHEYSGVRTDAVRAVGVLAAAVWPRVS